MNGHSHTHTNVRVETTKNIYHTLRMREYNNMGTKRLLYEIRGVKTKHKVDIS